MCCQQEHVNLSPTTFTVPLNVCSLDMDTFCVCVRVCVCVLYVRARVCMFSGAEGCGRMRHFVGKRIRLRSMYGNNKARAYDTIANEYVNNSGLFFRHVTLLCLCIFILS